MFASGAMIVTFALTIYNQVKTNKPTEISGIVFTKGDSTTPIDAIVSISSPIQAQTETDSNGRFKFKVQNLQSDTFLLIVQDKATKIISKQTEYVSSWKGRTDIIVLSRSVIPETTRSSVAATPGRASRKKRSGLNKTLRRIFN